jgi:nucleotide-binding universal stress UspA family protein
MILICFDGSDHAKRAIDSAAGLLAQREALVLSVWPSAAALPAFAWGSAGAGIDYELLDRQSTEAAEKVAGEGVEVARAAGLEATPLVARAPGPVWETIVDVAEQRDVDVVVMGARGLTGLKNIFLGSVSEGVTRHGRRPTLVIHGQE